MNWFKKDAKGLFPRRPAHIGVGRRRLLVETLEDRTLLSGAQSYLQLPLSFEANQGQTDAQVQYLARGPGYSLFLTPGEAVLSLSQGGHGQTDAVVRTQIVGANLAAQAVGLDRQPGTSNYFIGDDPSKWHADVPLFARVEYQDVYAGVNLAYYGTNQRQLEYDFVVAPGTDPGIIRLAIQGTESIRIDAHGNLILHTSQGDVVQNAPVMYQEWGGVRHLVAGSFVLLGDNEVGFQIGAYDKTKTLTIDPVLVYSTYLGGSGADNVLKIALDSSNNLYLTGYTGSADFPTPSGFDNILGGSTDAFVTKINAAGSALVYSTYLGGALVENDNTSIIGGFAGIAVDAAGNAYITGATNSADFPTTPTPIQGTLNGLQNAFVTKLNPAGNALVYSTYLGGSVLDAGDSIAVDAAGNAYVTGLAASSDFPTTVGAFQTANGGFFDAFAAKINPAGSALVFSTYLGGTGGDVGLAIAVDSTTNVFVYGWTSANNFPTAGGLDTTLGGTSDAFVTKLNPTGTNLIYSTYLGGSQNENEELVQNSNVGYLVVDTAGTAFITGSTASNDFPVQAAVDNILGGTWDAFVTVLTPTGTTLFSTYLGGSGNDYGTGIFESPVNGNLYVTGFTESTDFSVLNPTQATLAGGSGRDAFVCVYRPPGVLTFATYLGGPDTSQGDIGRAIVADANLQAYVAGYTDSSAFPTQSPLQPASGGGGEGFVTKIAFPGIVVTESGGTTNVTEAGGTDTYTVVLQSVPTQNVFITLNPSSSVSVSPATVLTFTTANYNVAQTVTVSAANDTIVQGPHTGTISSTVTSADASYNGLTVAAVTANIADDDVASVTVTQTGGTNVTEGGTNDTYTVVLTSTPSASVFITLTVDAQVLVLPLGPLTFTTLNWMIPQTVTVTAVNDSMAEGTHSGTVTQSASSADSSYNGTPVSPVVAAITDNDFGAVVITQTGASTDVTENGASDTYTLNLSTLPAADVIITLSNPDGQINFVPSPLTFTTLNWNTPQTVTVTAIDDSIAQGSRVRHIDTAVASSDPGYNGISVPTLSVNITDNDAAGVGVIQTGGSTDVTEGSIADSYTVVLNSQPQADVTFNFNTGTQIIAVSPLLFTALNWNVPQTVTVTAIDDGIVEAPGQIGLITQTSSSADAAYNNLATTITAQITDRTVTILLSQSGGSTDVTEGSIADAYTIALSDQPTVNVTIAVSGAPQLSLSPSTLIFTPADWNSPQTVNVAAVDDSVIEGNHVGVITHTITTTDPAYALVTLPNLTVSVTDNDLPPPGVIILQSGGSTLVAEGGATDGFSMSLASIPSADVIITLVPDAQTATSPTLITFTSTNWNVVQNVTVTAVDDNQAEGPHTGAINFAVVSADPSYNGFGISSVLATILDNDRPGIIIGTSGPLNAAEGGASGSYIVALAAQPAADVILNLNANSQVNLAPSGVTFTPANWNTPQTVVVTAIDDNNPEGHHLGVIGHTFTSSDINFNSLSLPSAVVNITDNDSPDVVVFGTAKSDQIIVASSPDRSRILVTVNGVQTVYTRIGSLQILAGDGNDSIQINTQVVAVIVDGENGTDAVFVVNQANFNNFQLGASSLLVNGTGMSLDNVESLAVSGKALSTTFTVLGVPSFPVLFRGDNGTDRLFADNSINSWNITAPNTGTLNNSITFIAIETLIGGALADTFHFAAAKGVTGQIDGGGGFDTFDYSQYATPVQVNWQKLTATATGAAGFRNIENIIGGQKVDSLVGANQSNLWSIAGANTGTLNNHIVFQSFESLVGGAQGDTFRFAAGASVQAKIDGGPGKDFLDFAGYTSPVALNLQAKTATGTGGILNIEDFTGASALGNSLTAANTNNFWSLSGPEAGSIVTGNSVFSFRAVANLSGGILADSFLNAGFLGGSWSGLLSGGAGTDTLAASAANHFWNITSRAAGTLDGLNFSSVENLKGNLGTDAFVFAAAGKIDGKIDGAAGIDALDLSALTVATSVNLATGRATGSGSILGLEQFIAGFGPGDMLVAPNRVNAWNLTAPNTGDVGGLTFAGFENLTGGSLADTFTLALAGTWTGDLVGGAGLDTLVANPAAKFYVITGPGAGTLNGRKFSAIETRR